MAKDPLAEKLTGLVPKKAGNVLRVEALFGDRPEVKREILAALKRGISLQQISAAISTSEMPVSRSAVGRWVEVQEHE